MRNVRKPAIHPSSKAGERPPWAMEHVALVNQSRVSSNLILRQQLADEAERRATDTVFEQLYAATFTRVYAFMRCQVSTTETAQDLVSRAYLKAYRHREKMPCDDGGVNWIFRVAHTTLIDYWRVEKKREMASVPPDELFASIAPGRDPEVAYRLKEQTAHLVRSVGEMPADDRVLLGLKFAAQRTNREIAAILQISEGAVSMRLLRALRRLRERLRELGW